jgi:iron complex outermembrane receptor protein
VRARERPESTYPEIYEQQPVNGAQPDNALGRDQMKNFRTLLGSSSQGALGCALLISVAAIPSQAFAQQAAPQAAPQAAAAESNGVEEIVVTAQRRKENMQSVPISVSAVTSNALAKSGVTATLQINQVVPSVQITRSGPSTIFFIRGVGNSSGGIGEEGANAFYVDGVFLGDLAQVNTEFNNIDRIEVLKGPQGTLFGRNSSGGLVNIITRDPGDQVVVKANVGYANYKTWNGQFYGASPLTDKLSVDIALTARDQNKGWGKNLRTGDDFELGWMVGARSKAVWRPDDSTKITLSGDYKKQNDNFTMGFQLFNGSVGADGSTYQGDYNTRTTSPSHARIRSWGTSLTVEHEFDWATLTSLTASRYIRVSSAFDSDYTPAPLVNVDVESSNRTFQQEVRLASPTNGRLTWQVGGFYYHGLAKVLGQDVTGAAFGANPANGQSIVDHQTVNSIAGFGEATYAITPTTHLTGGLRYTHETHDFAGQQFGRGQIPTTAPFYSDSASFNKLTFRAAIRQDITNKINVYASFNRGFKSGLFSMNSVPGSNPPVKPQVTDAFELGAKTELFDNMLRFNIAGFHYHIKDYQVRSAAIGGIGNIALLLNAAVVKVDGVEADFEFVPVRELHITGNATYLNSRFGSFPNYPYTIPKTGPVGLINTRTCTSGPTGPLTGGNIQCFMPATGNRTPLSPKFALSIGATYTMDVGKEGQVIANVLYSYTGLSYFEPDNRLKQKAFGVVNAGLEYRPNPNWGIEVWGKNLNDKHYYITGASSTTGDNGVLGPPRTYGVRAKFDF